MVLAQEEARRLKHNYIGTEHILLGLIREDAGVAAQVLVRLGADLDGVRQQVIQLLNEHPAEGPGPALPDLARQRRQLAGEVERLRALLRQHGIDPEDKPA